MVVWVRLPTRGRKFNVGLQVYAANGRSDAHRQRSIRPASNAGRGIFSRMDGLSHAVDSGRGIQVLGAERRRLARGAGLQLRSGPALVAGADGTLRGAGLVTHTWIVGCVGGLSIDGLLRRCPA